MNYAARAHQLRIVKNQRRGGRLAIGRPGVPVSLISNVHTFPPDRVYDFKCILILFLSPAPGAGSHGLLLLLLVQYVVVVGLL